MAFKKLSKPTRSGGSPIPMITIGTSDQNRQTYLSLNTAARKALGDPAAVFLEWDDEDYLLRIVASSPDDPASYSIAKGTGRISVTRIMRELGLTPADRAYTTPAKPHGRLALIASVADMHTTGTITPMRRTA